MRTTFKVFRMGKLLLVVSGLVLAGTAMAADSFEEAPIYYSRSEPKEEISRLKQLIAVGKSPLQGESEKEVLQSLLDWLDVPVESQVLVYSKTSAQNSRIGPRTPRAIYFSDDYYVGWVQGGAMEIVTFDPNLGAVFWLVDARRSTETPEVTRSASCLNCHASGATRDVPGLLVRSVYPGPDGLPEFRAGSHQTGHESPIEERWGGWYVTGNSGAQTHLGNAIARESADGTEIYLEPLVENPTQLTTLDEVIHTEPYLAGGSSDIVALMVLEHQKGVHNALVKANLDTRRAMHWQEAMYPDRKPGDVLTGTAELVVNSRAERVVEELLFKEEFQMVDEGVEGGEAFAAAFTERAKVNSDGRSLRDFRLYERMFKYRCSYLIHSRAFAHLPAVTRDAVYRRLHQILTAPAPPEGYEYLGNSERQKILSILRETKPELPAYFTREEIDG